MAISNRQIGGSTTTTLLWQISKQLEELICIRSGGCGQITSTTTSSTTAGQITSTTTSSTTAIPIECLVYLTTNGNVYVYDPISNLSVGILSGGVNSYFQAANTDTKLWSSQGGGYINEYDITFSPGPSATYNRLINTGSINSSGRCAIDNTTLIVGDATTLGIYELDITTNTSINTLKGNIEAGYWVNDLLLTTSGKLIIVATNPPNNTSTKLYQYDYATWTLEISFDLSSQLPALTYGVGMAQYNGDIYIFTRIVQCGNDDAPSGVYILDTLTNNITLVNSTGFTCPSGASSWLPCNTQSLRSICGNEYRFGGGESYPSVRSILLGSGIGNVPFNFDADNQPDRFILEWNSNVVIDTGYRGDSSYNFGELFRTDFTSELTGRIDPITLNTYPDFTTYPDDGYPLVISPGLGSTSFFKSLALPDEVTVSVYAPMPTTAWRTTVECPNCCQLSDVTIGTQTWTACNLNVDTYRNGDPIPQATNASEWNELTTGAWCYYNFDPANCIYGKQYNWYAVADPRGLAPVGYHIPNEAEWNLLGTFLGGASVAGAELKQTGTTLWNAPNTGATNSTGWTGLPGGYTTYFGTFSDLGNYGTFWSSEDYAPGEAWRRYLSFDNILLQTNGARKDSGMSVRLIKDPVGTTTTTTLAPSGFRTIYTHFESL